VLKWTRTSFLCFPFAAEFLSSLSSSALSDLWSDIMEEFLICADLHQGGSGGGKRRRRTGCLVQHFTSDEGDSLGFLRRPKRRTFPLVQLTRISSPPLPFSPLLLPSPPGQDRSNFLVPDGLGVQRPWIAVSTGRRGGKGCLGGEKTPSTSSYSHKHTTHLDARWRRQTESRGGQMNLFSKTDISPKMMKGRRFAERGCTGTTAVVRY
jgi:hypothetical protein